MENSQVSPFRPPKLFKPEELALIRSTIQKRQPNLLPLLDLIGKQPLTEDQREALQNALLDEFLGTGLKDGDEPTEYGRQLDDLIGRLTFL